MGQSWGTMELNRAHMRLVMIFGRKGREEGEQQGRKDHFKWSESLTASSTLFLWCHRSHHGTRCPGLCCCTSTHPGALNCKHHPRQPANALLRNPLACLPEPFSSTPLLPLASSPACINKPLWTKSSPGATAGGHRLSAPRLASASAAALASTARKQRPAGKIPQILTQKRLGRIRSKNKGSFSFGKTKQPSKQTALSRSKGAHPARSDFVMSCASACLPRPSKSKPRPASPSVCLSLPSLTC